MLGNAHAVADNGALRVGVKPGDVLDLLALHTGDFQDMVPVGGVEIGFQLRKTLRVLADKHLIDYARFTVRQRLLVHRQQDLHDAFQHRRITADAHFVVGRGEFG